MIDGDKRWHVLRAAVQDGSLITECRGRSSQSDAVRVSELPPAEDRCGACVAELTVKLQDDIERNLSAFPPTYVDIGGEG